MSTGHHSTRGRAGPLKAPQAARAATLAWCSTALALTCWAAASCTPLSDLDRHSSEYAPGDPLPDPDGSPALGDAGSGPGAPDAAPDNENPPPLAVSDAAAPSGGDAGAVDARGPSISSSVPADGAIGVRRDTTLSISFSEPMDKSSVETAFDSDSLPGAAPEFRWDADGTLLNIVVAEPLSYATGTDPSQVSALVYDYGFTSAARALSGNPLTETHISFATLREIDASFNAQTDSGLTGNWRSDGIYGTDSCAPTGSGMCVGDSSFGPNASYSGFVSFDVSALSGASLDVIRAELEIDVVSSLGDPFGGLGQLMLEHMTFATIGPEAFEAQAVAGLGSVGSVSAGAVIGLDVLAAVQADRGSGVISQYRFRFQTRSDGDGATDLLFLERPSARLRVSYLVP